MARQLLGSCAMQPIDPPATPDLASLDPESLALVNGGFGALLGALLQAAPGILQGVSGIISAAKSGGGSGSAPAAAPAQGQGQQPDPSSTQTSASAAPAGSQSSCSSCGSAPQFMQMFRCG